MGSTSKRHDVEIHESLDVYNDPPKATVDIVAIPGLGANAVESWQYKPGSGFNWIAGQKTADGKPTGLAKDCPTARILLYNYASAYQGAFQVKQHMTNIVDMLLIQLKARREGISRRPLILMGHSMGGLVIAKALVQAETQRHDYPDVYEAIAGCVTFGTPFDGAPVADIAKEWVTINERLGRATDSHLITLLQPGNETLRELKNDFVRSVNKLGHKVMVHCIYERKETHWEDLIKKLTEQDFPPSSLSKLGLKEYRQFVSRDSATLSGMKQIGIQRTHRDLVRFESDKDPEYQTVKAILRELVNAAPRTAKARFNDTRRLSIDSQTYRDILKVLEGAEPRLKLKSLQQKITSESWIVRDRDAAYIHWLEKEDRPTDYLWIHGPEGKGKSTAVATIIRAIDERTRRLEETSDQSPHLLAYFFCEPTPDYCTAEDVVKSLMYQLCQQQEILATYAKQFQTKQSHNTEGPGHKASLGIENLWQSLEEMLSEASVSTIYFVINNLNDLEKSPSTGKLFSFIEEDIARMASGIGHKVRTRWLFTSRSHKNMQDMFVSTEVRKINLDDPKYGDQQKQALQKYAWIKAEDLQKTKGYTMAMKYLTGSVIGNRADNTKWIDVAVVQLAALPAKASEVKVQRMLEHVPQNFKELLDDAWNSILKRNDEDMDIVIELLRALVLTHQDPNGKELLVLAGFLPHDINSNDHLQKLVRKCQPLITTHDSGEDQVIGFVDPDVKKHLLTHSKELLHIGDDWIKWQHGKMSLRCLSHIMDALKNVEPETSKTGNELSAMESSLQESMALRQRDSINARSNSVTSTETNAYGVNLALKYATRYWLRHASEASFDVAEIISREHLFWHRDSAQRKRWIQEYENLTNSFAGFEITTWKALHVAAVVGFPRLVTALLKEGHDEEIHEYDSLNNKPVHLAAWNGDVEILEILLHAGSPVNNMGPSGHNSGPLAMAAYNGQTEMMKKLIVDWKADVDAVNDQTGPVLNAAILSGNIDAVSTLLEHGARVNYDIDEVVVSPLAMSAFHSDIKMFSAILEKIKNDLTELEYDKAMITASGAENLGVLRTLLSFEHEHGAYQASLNAATEESNWEACLLVLRHSSARDLDCNALFSRAAIDNDVLDEILQACWDNNNGGIPQDLLDECLYEATDKEKESTVKLLLDFKADPNATGQEFGNALTASANDGTEKILSLLLKAGADVNSPSGWALQQASSQGHLNVVEMLISHGADVNHSTTLEEAHEARTALQAACNYGHIEIVKLLLENGANPNLGGGHYGRPIFGAICDGGEAFEELLKAPGLELDVVGGPYSGTPLFTASYHLSAERLSLLIDHGATVDFLDDDADTALGGAVRAGDADCLRLLLEKGADFLKISHRNRTALEDAIREDDPDCIKLLLSRADFILRELQIAADQGEEFAQKIISREKSGRAAAMAKERTAEASEDVGSEDNDGAEGVSDSESNKASVHEANDPMPGTPPEKLPGHNLEGISNRYPTPESVTGDRGTEHTRNEDENEDVDEDQGRGSGYGEDQEDARLQGEHDSNDEADDRSVRSHSSGSGEENEQY